MFWNKHNKLLVRGDQRNISECVREDSTVRGELYHLQMTQNYDPKYDKVMGLGDCR